MNRYGKETGKATGSLNKPKGSPVKKGGSGDTALNFVRNKIRKETGRPEGQRKKVKGEKKQEGPSAGVRKAREKIARKKESKALDAKAKKAGYKSTQDYVNVRARYGSGGLGS